MLTPICWVRCQRAAPAIGFSIHLRWHVCKLAQFGIGFMEWGQLWVVLRRRHVPAISRHSSRKYYHLKLSLELLPEVLKYLNKESVGSPYACLGANPLKPSGYLYVPPGWTQRNLTFCPHSVFMSFVWISEQIAIISLYSINLLV